ncbi:MAG: hypothetical protein PHW04_04070 [Candidatus Wallbacteria bacterium]|nr:hypothetical protein [Candidatus Wallbacteria bacterium]
MILLILSCKKLGLIGKQYHWQPDITRSIFGIMYLISGAFLTILGALKSLSSCLSGQPFSLLLFRSSFFILVLSVIWPFAFQIYESGDVDWVSFASFSIIFIPFFLAACGAGIQGLWLKLQVFRVKQIYFFQCLIFSSFVIPMFSTFLFWFIAQIIESYKYWGYVRLDA